VNIKKGQWLHPEGMRGAADKVRGAQRKAAEIAVTERGSFFGYGDLVVDMRALSRMADATNCPVIFDGTHSVQQPGKGVGGASGGVRAMITPLTLAAAAAGANGLFLETHPDPDNAPSDGPNMIPLRDLGALLDRAIDVWAAATASPKKRKRS
jgi:2-dehydro-3-deoxyphosphooctonate aldolase (KDO 8-P synthase)